MAGEFDFLKEMGLSADDFKGKSKKQVMEIIVQKSKEANDKLAGEQVKELIDNVKTKLPKFKEQFEKPIEIYVKSVGTKKSATAVKVVGYNPDKKTYIVYKNDDKVYQIPEGDLITTEDEYADNQPKKGGSKAKSKTKKT
jgi:hypothetical protein